MNEQAREITFGIYAEHSPFAGRVVDDDDFEDDPEGGDWFQFSGTETDLIEEAKSLEGRTLYYDRVAATIRKVLRNEFGTEFPEEEDDEENDEEEEEKLQ